MPCKSLDLYRPEIVAMFDGELAAQSQHRAGVKQTLDILREHSKRTLDMMREHSKDFDVTTMLSPTGRTLRDFKLADYTQLLPLSQAAQAARSIRLIKARMQAGMPVVFIDMEADFSIVEDRLFHHQRAMIDRFTQLDNDPATMYNDRAGIVANDCTPTPTSDEGQE